MKQICDGYNPKVLMGNWYQESYSVSQPARDNPIKVARPKQFEIGFIDLKGRLKALNTVSRLQPWNTSNLVTNSDYDSQKEKLQTTNKQNYELPTVQNFHSIFKAQPFSKTSKINQNHKTHMKVDKFNRNLYLFNEQNCNELLVDRNSDTVSFKSQIKSNFHLNHQQFLQSIYQQQISKPKKININTKQCCSSQSQQLGLPNFKKIRSEITLNNVINFPFTCK